MVIVRKNVTVYLILYTLYTRLSRVRGFFFAPTHVCVKYFTDRSVTQPENLAR